MTASDGRHVDAALVRRFRQAQTRRERTAVFAGVVRRHGDAVLGCCAGRLWPDADAAVAAACEVLIAARLVMADPVKLARPDQLRGWLLGIAASDGLTAGLPARTDDINWPAVNARAAAGVPGISPPGQVPLRHWLEQIVATLPEPRQRLFGLFVARGLGSRDAARELGTGVAEVRRLRRENRQAVLRAFEVTALVAAEAALGPPGGTAPGCGDLRQILAGAPRDGGLQDGGQRRSAVLPAALRVAVTRHLSQCGACQGRRDDCMRRRGPELLPVLAGTELGEQVMEGLRAVTELARPRDPLGARRRAASAGGGGMAVARKPAAATGAGLLAALLLLAFVWPGFLHSTGVFAPRDSISPSSPGPGGSGARGVTGTAGAVSGHTGGRQVPPGGAALLNSPPPQAPGSLPAPSPSASPAPPGPHTVLPPAPASAAQPASGPPPASSPPALSPSTSQPAGVPATPPAGPASAPPTATPPSSSSPSAPPASTAPPAAPASSAVPSPALTSSAPPASTPSSAAPASSATLPPALAPPTPG